MSSCGGGNADSNVVAVPIDDPAIAAAQEEAQRRWPDFVASFRRSVPSLEHAIKISLPTADGSAEHLWVDVSAVRGDRISGTLANEPAADVGHAFGDRITVERRRIEDWLVTEGERVVDGGFSLEAVGRRRD